MHSLRRAVCALLAGVVLLAACGKSEPPPPPPKAEPPKPVAPTVNAELKRLAAEVYVFGFPLVLTDVTRAVDTAGLPPDTFRHTRALPDAKTPGPSPNADFLYSQAWLDLSNGPVILSVPDTKARYYLIAILDAWTNVAGSLGKRTTGTEKGEFAIVGPTWKGTLPAASRRCARRRTSRGSSRGSRRNGGADIDVATRVQNDLKLRPLKAPAKRDRQIRRAACGDRPGSRREDVAARSGRRDGRGRRSSHASRCCSRTTRPRRTTRR